jgi:hypothetical protein
MPYIQQQHREVFEEGLEKLLSLAASPGELNYLFTRLAIDYFGQVGKRNYQGINDVIGALEGAKLEFYRRVAAPYEDTKIKENGDVF